MKEITELEATNCLKLKARYFQEFEPPYNPREFALPNLDGSSKVIIIVLK